jgi:hypothetical protein
MAKGNPSWGYDRIVGGMNSTPPNSSNVVQGANGLPIIRVIAQRLLQEFLGLILLAGRVQRYGEIRDDFRARD